MGVDRVGSRDDDLSSDRHSSCDRPEERSLLLLYALSSCPEEDAIAFEAHLLGCDACFRDLRCLDRARVLIQEFTDAASPVRDRVRHAFGGGRADFEGTVGSSRIPGEASTDE